MCGRFTQMMAWEELVRLLRMPVDVRVLLEPRWNVTPDTEIAVLKAGDEGEIAAVPMRWGLRPDWAKKSLINATAEKLLEPGRGFWKGFRRCVVPVGGFYEWRATESGKVPVHFQRSDGETLLLAGLWRPWQRPEGWTDSAVVVTTQPNALAALVHTRMPAVLEPEDAIAWLDPERSLESAGALLRPALQGTLAAWPVSTRVNDSRQDAPELTEPAGPPLA